MAIWRNQVIADFARQLAYSPVASRTAMLRAARAMVHSLESARTYPWSFIHFKVTGHRPREFDDAVIDGPTLLADLATLVEAISSTLELTVADAGEAVLDERSLAARWGVSAKTVSRCRTRGLLGQRFIGSDGKRRLGFLASDVAAFVERHRAGIEPTARMTQLSSDERARIVTQARELATRGCSRGAAARQIAASINRAAETVRSALLQHDRAAPDAAVFDLAGLPIRPNRFAVAESAASPGETRESIARALRFERIDHLRQMIIPVVDNPLFEHPDALTIITRTLPREALAAAQSSVARGTNVKAFDPLVGRIPAGLPGDLRRMFMQPVMPTEMEIDTFRRMNFLRYRARAIQRDLIANGGDGWDRMETLLAEALKLKNQLVQANLRIAIHVARKHVRPGRALLELVSDAMVFLMHAVDRFDFARGVAFSTYASYVVMKNLARERRDRLSAPDRMLVTGQEPVLAGIKSVEPTSGGGELDAAAQQRHLRAALDTLPARERTVLASRFGLDGREDPQSLSALAERMGVTKTRVRQLETRALATLRRIMVDGAGECRAVAACAIAG
jgi:RNA polymerase primary sigma factor